MDDITRLLGSIISGGLDGYQQNQRLDKTIQAQEDIALLKDSLSVKNTQQLNENNRENALLSDSLGVKNAMLEDSLDTERMMRADSLANERHEDTQRFQKGNQALGLMTALGPAMTDTKNQELSNQIAKGDFRYENIRTKVRELEDAKRDARQWTPDLNNLNRRTLQFRTEKSFPFSETDMLNDYTEVRDDLELTVLEALKLPPNDMKRAGVLKFLNKMVKRAGHTDFLDGDWGIFGGEDPDGAQAQAIKDELETWQTLLKDKKSSNSLLDDMYNISPEDRKFYQEWRGQRGALSGKKIANVDAQQAEMMSVLKTLVEQSNPSK